MPTVAVALGSNLGDRHATLHLALVHLRAFLHDLRASPFYDTVPVGVGEQPTFLNAAAVGRTALSPRELLERLLVVERTCGRTRPSPGAARTLDLDLVLYDDAVLDEPDLVVPHPRFRERAFVLQPLADIAPSWIDPVTGRTVKQLLDGLPEDGRRGVSRAADRES